ncbi:MAG: long-chain fatty acid--CoA ligase [Proteobacteria bacterium]|nr:long-chain fatty acid--CoA ligase [Pseudomonadota bacterium]
MTAPIRRMALMAPDAPAIVDSSGSVLSYAALDRGIDLMAGHAVELGLGPGDIAGLSVGRAGQATSLILLLGLARIGVATVDPGHTAAHRWSFRYGSHADPGQVRFDATWLADALAGAPVPPAAMHDDPHALFRILSSSGTTGMPKLIPTSHALTVRRLYSRFASQGPAGQRQMIANGLTGVGSIVAALSVFWQGATLVLFDPDTAVDLIGRFDVDAVTTSPGTLHMILAHRPEGSAPLPGLRELAVGSAHVPPPLRRLAEARLCPNVFIHAGSSETGRIAFGPASAMDGRTDAAGFVTPGITVQALDESGRVLPPGEAGLLRIQSDSNADGYFNDPEATARDFRDGWYYSGDIGTVWPDGILSLSGRVAELIDIGGDKFNPALIESVLERFPGVTEAAVFAVPDALGLNELHAALAVSAPVDPAELETFCRQHLPRMPLAAVLEVTKLPRNEAGKVQRDRLAALSSVTGK